MSNLISIQQNYKTDAQQHGDSLLLARDFANLIDWRAAERANEDKVSGDAPKDQDSG